MSDRDNTDIWTAVAIGAVVGIGTALIVRARQDDETHEIIRRLRPVRKRAGKTMQQARRELGRQAQRAGETGEELVSAGRDMLHELREGAAEIVRDTRKELKRAAKEARKAALEGASDAQRAARRAARRVAR
jgi:gas vesicle protein